MPTRVKNKQPTTRDLRYEGKKLIDSIESKRRLRRIVETLRDIHELESFEATEEIERIPGIHEKIREGEEDIAAGRTVNWRDVRDEL